MDRTTDSSNETKSLPLMREVDFAKQKTEGEMNDPSATAMRRQLPAR